MAIFFGGESAQKQNVVVALESPLWNLRWRQSSADHGPVGHVCSLNAIGGLVVPLQSLGNDHSAIRQPCGGEFSEAESERGKAAPLFSLPILSLNRDDSLLSDHSREKRKQGRTLSMVVHDVTATEHYVDCAQPGVHECLEVLGAECGQPNQPHSLVLRLRRSKVAPAIDSDVVTHLHQPLANFLVVGFDPAVF